MNKISSKKQLVMFLKKTILTISEYEINSVLYDIQRFVNLSRKIYTEPQANISYQDVKVGNKILKKRIFKTSIEEFAKVVDNNKHSESISDVASKFIMEVTKN